MSLKGLSIRNFASKIFSTWRKELKKCAEVSRVKGIMWLFRLAFQHLLLCYQTDKIYYCGFVAEFIKISENAIKS